VGKFIGWKNLVRLEWGGGLSKSSFNLVLIYTSIVLIKYPAFFNLFRFLLQSNMFEESLQYKLLGYQWQHPNILAIQR
jgi:hypothetical protein